MTHDQSILRRMWNRLFDRMTEEEGVERAMSMSRLRNAVWNLLDEVDAETDTWNWLLDIYADGGELFAIVAREGLLYRIGITVAGDTVTFADPWTRVTEAFPSVGESESTETRSTLIRQQPDGRYRWFSVSASSVLNRVAEIDSRDLFDSFVEHAEETGEYPIRQIVHLGETLRTGQADWLARDGNLYLTSGLYDETPLAQIEIQARQNNPDAWGDSIGYLPIESPELVELTDGVSIPVYRAGINKEISTLLEADAANLFTVGRIQEVNRMTVSTKQMETLVALYRDAGSEDPEADVQAMLDDLGVEERNRSIEENGLITRAAEEADEAEEDDEEAQGESEDGEEEPEGQAFELDEPAMRAIADIVTSSDVVTRQTEALDTLVAAVDKLTQTLEESRLEIGTLRERLAAVERDDADKQQEWLEDLPRRMKTKVTYRPRTAHQSDDPDEPLTMEEEANRMLKTMPSY